MEHPKKRISSHFIPITFFTAIFVSAGLFFISAQRNMAIRNNHNLNNSHINNPSAQSSWSIPAIL
ncbi:MAG: hypothetical protein ACO3AQ_07180, partial [Bacteroidia bacterium]